MPWTRRRRTSGTPHSRQHPSRKAEAGGSAGRELGSLSSCWTPSCWSTSMTSTSRQLRTKADGLRPAVAAEVQWTKYLEADEGSPEAFFGQVLVMFAAWVPD